MRSKLKDLLTMRIKDEIAPQSPLKFLKNIPVDEYLDTVISIVYLYTRPKKGSKSTAIYFAEITSALGHQVRKKLKQKTDSSAAVKTGAFFLYSIEQLGMVEVILGQGSKGHGTYIVNITNDDEICELWAKVDPNKAEKLPATTPYAPWVSSRHTSGAILVKTQDKDVLAKLSPDTHPIVFNCINKAQAQGWIVNEDVYRINMWALKNKTDAFADVWEQSNPEARATKLREVRTIGDVAKRFLGKTFYHLYYYDFRGRKYPATAYLHEQGSDLARGLLLRSDKKAINKTGFFWLCVSIASNWGGDAGREDGLKTDKLPLVERYTWVLDNEEIFLAYASSPKLPANAGWMHADKPWQFLAACIELMKLRTWQFEHGDPANRFEDYSYESHLEVYIDGSNNGSQHLAALTRDEITAPLVNLVPQALPGDLYKYVGDHVWGRLEKKVAQLTEEEIALCEEYIDTLIEMKRKITEADPKSPRREALIEDIQGFKNKNEKLGIIAGPVYWMRIRDPKHRRKIVKRNVMTLPYGGTAYGLGQQQIDDAKKHGIAQLLYLEHKWGSFLGREIFEDCKVSLQRPMQLLQVFERAGKEAEARGEFLSWTVPVTGFPVVQHYTEGVVKKIWVQYGPPEGDRRSTGYFKNTFQIAISFVEDVVPSSGKQASGASPNAIHSLDAAHLALTVYRCDFSVTTIHDSFGCLLADMPELFGRIRHTFVELYAADPLTSLMQDIGGDITNVQIGNLDIDLIRDTEYSFV